MILWLRGDGTAKGSKEFFEPTEHVEFQVGVGVGGREKALRCVKIDPVIYRDTSGPLTLRYGCSQLSASKSRQIVRRSAIGRRSPVQSSLVTPGKAHQGPSTCAFHPIWPSAELEQTSAREEENPVCFGESKYPNRTTGRSVAASSAYPDAELMVSWDVRVSPVTNTITTHIGSEQQNLHDRRRMVDAIPTLLAHPAQQVEHMLGRDQVLVLASAELPSTSSTGSRCMIQRRSSGVKIGILAQ